MTLTAKEIDAWLPQTQCTRCGYPCCRAYAEALACGEAELNQCPPGGEVTIQALARLLGRAARPLNPEHGAHGARMLAVIDEARCIGCRKCLDVCPVDAILGAHKLMHTVLAADCTGCELCLPPCPVDCIAMVPALAAPDPHSPWPEYARADTARWRDCSGARLQRLARRKPARAARRPRASTVSGAETERQRIRAEIRAAVARVRARKQPT